MNGLGRCVLTLSRSSPRKRGPRTRHRFLNLLLSGFPGMHGTSQCSQTSNAIWRVTMRTIAPGMLAFALATVLEPATVRAYDLPYDPYPWCAVYSDDAGGASNCGFLTIEQCRATVSGIGGFCEPNQFYNPRRAAARSRNRGSR